MENNNETFTYTYSAKEQSEIRRIRQKYATREADPMEQLRRLDMSVTQKATAVSLVVGIIGALILGVGMCCCLVWQGGWFLPGIVIGLIGLGMAALAHPVYTLTLKRERQKVAPEILRLTDELLK